MGVKVREKPKGSGSWYVFVNLRGDRQAKKVGWKWVFPLQWYYPTKREERLRMTTSAGCSLLALKKLECEASRFINCDIRSAPG
jgi:hypothetical protein